MSRSVPWYVDGTNGSDSYTPATSATKGQSTATAFKTIQAAVDFVSTNFSYMRYIATIIVAAGTYNEDVLISNGTTKIQGNYYGRLAIKGVNKVTTIITGCVAATGFVLVEISNFTIRYANRASLLSNWVGLEAARYAIIEPAGIIIDATSTTNQCTAYRCSQYGYLYIWGSEQTIFTGNCVNVLDCFHNALVRISSTANIVINTTENAVIAALGIFKVNTGGFIDIAPTADIGGTATGRRFYVYEGGGLDTQGAGPNRIPGTIAGAVNASSYGWYV